MICKNCGSKVDDSAKFCIYCGSRLTDESVEYKEEVIYEDAPEQGSAGSSAAGQSSYDYGAPEQPKTVYTYQGGTDEYYGKKKSGSGKIILAIALVVVLILVASLIKVGLGLFASGSYSGEPTETETTETILADTDEFAQFMMGEWTTKLGGNYFEVTEDEEYYYYETDLPINNDAEHSWYVMDNVMFIYYSEDGEDEPYLLFNVRDEDTVEIYSYQEDYTRIFHRR